MKGISLTRWNQVLLSLVLLGVILHYAKDVIILLLFAALLAMLVKPLADKLEKKGWKRVWSTLVCLLVLITAFGGIVTLFSIEVKQISKQAPQMKPKMEKIRTQLQGFVEEKLNIPVKEQDQKLREKAKNMEAKVGDFAKKFVAGVFGAIAGFALTMVFTCLFLFQREKYKTFVLKLYKGDNVIALEKVLTSISKVSQKYLTGMSYSIMILTTLYTVGFLIIGLQNAFLLAFIAAVMVIIPYVGAWIGGLVPFSMALITGDSGMAFSVAAVLVGVQLVDNNFIEPYVVGGEVRLSFAATMVALLTGGALWGIAGVVLFVPLMGILRIIFDHIEPMQPYGFLIGDQKPPPSKGMSSLFRNVMFRRRR